SKMVEDLPAPADLRAGAEALDRVVGLPPAILRRLDRHVRLARAAPPREAHEQAFAAARLQLHGTGPLGYRQQHPVAIAELAMADRHRLLLGAAAPARHVAPHVLPARVALLDAPDQPAQVHTRGQQPRPP